MRWARSNVWATAEDHGIDIEQLGSASFEFSCRKGLGDQFSSELAVRFLEEYRLTGDEIDMSGQGWRKHVVWGVRALADFAENGRIERAFTDLEAIHLVPDMQNTLCDYAQYCKDRLQLRPGTLHERTIELTIFLDFLHSRKARTLDQIQALDLSEFLSCRADLPPVGKIRRDRWLQPTTVARIVSDMRSFLRFLTMRGILHKDPSAALPKVRVPRDAKIPSVWEQELVIRLLEEDLAMRRLGASRLQIVDQSFAHFAGQRQTGTMTIAKDGNIFERSLIHPDRNDWAPRVGFSFVPYDGGAIRGAYGMFYSHTVRQGREGMLAFNPPHLVDNLIISPVFGPTAVTTLCWRTCSCPLKSRSRPLPRWRATHRLSICPLFR